MASRADDQRPGGPSPLLTAALVLAVAATVGAFLTDDARYLRAAVVAAAWAFAAAAFVAVRRRGEQQAVLLRETELRRAYERELDLEAAARREFELELENDLRRRAEAAVQDDLGDLRADIAALDRVREELGRAAAGNPAELAALRTELESLGALRDDIASLSSLRGDLTALASLRHDVAALGALRADLGQLAELRADVSRLRTEIVEQLNGELLVERISMRTQATRKPAESSPTAPPSGLDVVWEAEPPARELSSGWSTFRLDDPGPTSEYEIVRPVTVEPRTQTFPLQPAPPEPEPARSPLQWLADRSLLDPEEVQAARHARHAAANPQLSAAVPAAAAPEDPAQPIPYRRRRTDAPPGPTLPPYADRPDPAPVTDGHARLAEILAENGGTAPSGRRRRRYREDDEPDDVLSRVLREQ
jgi:hypothetical protein